MKRVFLLIVTNLAVVMVINIALSLLGGDRFLTPYGIDLTQLSIYSLIVGFTGAIISLLLSKPMAKWSTGVRIIEQPQNASEQWLLNTVADLAQRAGIGMPEVGVFEGDANAFATGAFRDSALVAVSTGLLEGMNEDEVRAVLAHEISHIANGDMVTLTLVQGVVNTFVVFLSRVLAFAVATALSRGRDDSSVNQGVYTLVSLVLQLVLGVFATMIVMYVSRIREYRADSGAADLIGSSRPMIGALERLRRMHTAELPPAVKALGIAGNMANLFASHPPLEDRIAALQQRP